MLKRLIIIYALFLVLVIVLADSGQAVIVFSALGQIPYGDKLGHFVLMGIMSFLLTLAIEDDSMTIRRIAFWKAPFWFAVVVTLEEISQVWLSNRGFSLLDLAFDYLGILVFAQAVIWLRTRTRYARQ